MLPDIYSAQVYLDAVASNYYKYKSSLDENDPSTPAFQLNQLAHFLINGSVVTAVYDDSTTPFELTFDATNQQFVVGQGTVRNNNTDYVISEQRFKYCPVFGIYNTSDYYIATIYVDVVTLDNNTLKTLTLNKAVGIGDTEIFVEESSILPDLQPPLKLQIGSSLYQVGSIDLFAKKLTLSSSSSAITAAASLGTKVYVIQEPILGCSYTDVFSLASDAYLSNCINKALIPSNCLRLYDILMQNPNSPNYVTTSGTIQKKTNFVNFKLQTVSSGSAGVLATALQTFNFNLNQSQTALDLDVAITNFNAATQNIAGTSTVSKFWLDTILLQPEVISVGVDLGRYKKFDFPNNYLKANWEIGTGNLYELIAGFDPTFYSNTNIYSGNTTVSNTTVSLLENFGPVSNALPSVIVHGVTAVINTNYPSGETPVSYYASDLSTESSANPGFEIKFTPSNSNSYQYYNIYRKSVYNNKSIDLPLSNPQEIQGDPNFGAFLPSEPISGSSYSGFTGSFGVLNTNGVIGKFATRFDARLPSGSLAAKVFVGGVAVTFSSTTSYSGNSSIRATLVLPNPTLSSYTTLGISDLMPVSKISSTPKEFSFKFTEYTTGSLNLTPSSTYYVIFEIVNSDLTNFSILGSTATASGALAQGYTGSWGNISNLAFNFRTLGFVDNLSTTGSVINTSLPSSNYIFRGVRQIRQKITRPRLIYAYVPYFKLAPGGTKEISYTSNEMLVRIVGLNSETGEVIDTSYVSIPAGTAAGEKVLLSPNLKKMDQIYYVTVTPGTDITVDSNGQIIWGDYDYLLVIADE